MTDGFHSSAFIAPECNLHPSSNAHRGVRAAFTEFAAILGKRPRGSSSTAAAVTPSLKRKP